MANRNENRDVPEFLVPDLTPMDRKELGDCSPRVVFIAESPHVSEIAPAKLKERRPLCGLAGRKWWSFLGEILEGELSEDVSLERMIRLCRKNGVAIMNAVQYPLDRGISKSQEDADPLKTVGFCKNPGPYFYKKMKSSPEVRKVVEALRARLMAPEFSRATFHCLGNDAQWFVEQALSKEERALRLGDKLPHPSAWWRRGGFFGRVAREKLREIFSVPGQPADAVGARDSLRTLQAGDVKSGVSGLAGTARRRGRSR